MAIYKLGEFAVIKRGSSPRPINSWLRKNGIMWAKISDLEGNYLNKTKEFIDIFWESKGLIGKTGDLFITNSATPGVPFIQNALKVAYHDGFLSIIPNKNILLKKYLFYKLIIDRPKLIKMGNGAVFINLSSEILKEWLIEIPDILIQKKIIDSIEPNEKLFLKYSNCIRIDNLENVKKDMKNLIDIIEPIEKIATKALKIIIDTEALFLHRQLDTSNTIFNNITWKSNGFNYKEEDKNLQGSYKIFTIKNINDVEKFNKTNIVKNNIINIGDVVTGLSGTIGTSALVFKKNWVSNQRTLTLRSKIPLNIKVSIEKQQKILIKEATGAVQKNITAKNVLDLKIIKQYEFDEKLNYLYIKILIINNKLKNLKNSLINLLIK